MPPTAIGGDEPADVASDLDILNDTGENPDASTESGDEGEETPASGEGEETPDPSTGEEGEESEDVDDPDAADEDKDKEKELESTNDRATPELAKKLKTEYPDLFKKYPEVRRALFQADKFSEVFPTVEEAKEAAEKVQNYDVYEQQLMTGDPTLLLTSLRNTDPDVLKKFAMNLLPSVEKISTELRSKMVYPYLHRILGNALSDAKASGNTNLEHGIGWLNKYLWGKAELPELAKDTPAEDNPELQQMKQRNSDLSQRLANEFSGSVFEQGVGNLRTSVEMTLKNDKRFSPIEKKAMTEDIVKHVRVALEKNPRHMRAMQLHWQKARSEGYPKQGIPRVVNAFLGGAKSLMPAIRAKVLASALREKGITEAPKGNIPGAPRTGGPAAGGRGVVSSKNIDYRNTSDADILSGDSKRITLKKRG